MHTYVYTFIHTHINMLYQEMFMNPRRPRRSRFWCKCTGVSLSLSLGHPTVSDAAEWEPPALNRTRLYRKWRAGEEVLAWQVSSCMTNVSQQVGALKQNHKQSRTVWKYINHQTALWLTTARKQLGSNSGVCTWYSGVAWVQLQVKLSDFFSFKMESSPKSRFGLSVLIHIYMA